jgi:hypothetical protein
MAKQTATPKVTIGKLKEVVSNLKQTREEQAKKYYATEKDIQSGATVGQLGVAEMQAQRKKDLSHYGSNINRYSKIIDSTTIVHDKARLAEKESQYKRDYPLSPTFKSKM